MIKRFIRRREALAGIGAAAAAPWSGLSAQPSAVPGRLRITDAQVHIWSGGKPTAAQRQEPVSKDQLLKEMDEAGVERAVIVPVSWDPRGNQTAVDAARAHPSRLAVMGLLNIGRPESRALVETWRQQPGMLGIRLFLASPHGAKAMSDGSADWFWAAAEKADIAVSAHAGGLLPAIGKVAERHPGLRMCVDSLGAPPRTADTAAFADIQSLLMLARLPNVAVKAEGAPTLSSEPYPFKNVHPHLRRVYDAFGPGRLFWGSDFTRLKSTTYSQAVTMFTEQLPWLTARDKELIMGQAFSAWLKWPMPA